MLMQATLINSMGHTKDMKVGGGLVGRKGVGGGDRVKKTEYNYRITKLTKNKKKKTEKRRSVCIKWNAYSCFTETTQRDTQSILTFDTVSLISTNCAGFVYFVF